MAFELQQQGKQAALTKLLGAWLADLRVFLYTAKGGVAGSRGWADMTEATFTGYAAQGYAGAGPAMDGNANAQYSGTTLTFTRGAGAGTETILGWGVVTADHSILLGIQDLPTPVVINTAGQTITVTANMYLGLLPPPY